MSEERGAIREGDSWGRGGGFFPFPRTVHFRKDSMPEMIQRIRERAEKESLGLTLRKKNMHKFGQSGFIGMGERESNYGGLRIESLTSVIRLCM